MKKITTCWETKTNQMGSVTVPEIPMGEVTVQMIASNYQTFGDVFQLNQPEQTVAIKLNPPQAQYSEDERRNSGSTGTCRNPKSGPNPNRAGTTAPAPPNSHA